MGEEGHFKSVSTTGSHLKKKKKKLDSFLTPYTKINSRWLRTFDVKNETINILKETTGKCFYNLTERKAFLIMTDKKPGSYKRKD